MPIVHLAANDAQTFPDGANCPLDWNRPDDRARQLAEWGKVNAVVVYETHHGLCLIDHEHNMRDDSDFYMTVWDAEAGRTREIMYASTRGWTYPCMASRADATAEIWEAYQSWCAAKERRARIQARWNQRHADIELAQLCECSRADIKRLRAAHNAVDWERLKKLLESRPRKQFRTALRNQVLTWLRNPAPRYRTPLSRKQMECL